MYTRSITSLALLASTGLAAPSPNFVGKRTLLGPRDMNCEPGEQTAVVQMGFYSEHDCNDRIGGYCIYVPQSTIDAGKGWYECDPGLLPGTTPFYAKVEATDYPNVQVFYTKDQTCPPDGPGAIFASLVDSQTCVLMNVGGDGPGITIYPNGGSPLAKRAPVSENTASLLPRGPFTKRDGAKCSGFTTESQENSESESVQISPVVDCTNGAEAGCQIQVGQEETKSVTTSMSATAGGGIEGIFELSVTFGVEYTESSTTSQQEGFSIPQGQKGYLSAYSGATLFKGKFTGCDSGDAEQAGQVLAIKKNAFTYAIIYSGARKADVVKTEENA